MKIARWTGAEDKDATLGHVVEKIREKTGLDLKADELQLIEERDLANNHFQMYFQTAEGVPVRSRSVRLWTTLDSKEVVQVEAYLDDPAALRKTMLRRRLQGLSLTSVMNKMNKGRTMALVRRAIKANAKYTTDTQIRDVKWSEAWDNGELVRVVTVKSKHGAHHIVVSLDRAKVVSTRYEEFPQMDGNGEFNLPALVYPIYEEADGVSNVQPRVAAELKYLKSTVAQLTGDPYAQMRDRKYLESKYDPVLGETESGRAQGYWAMSYVKRQAAQLQAALPRVANSFDNGGVILDGRYATINIHPFAREKYTGVNFELKPSAQFKPDWRATVVDGQDVYEMVPASALLGKPLLTADEALKRPARRLLDHDPTSYMNDGFDEIQVYYAINTLVESLHSMGFTDPELSTRPFNAFLYDPDISMRDNAYYTDDTINFTTYSPKAPNYARDNSTIWHELGHGIMDRLMGDYIQLADTGGLSEGMADFVAALVIADVTKTMPFEGSDKFRIINKTGFNLTNEVHDDGEAYGGAMKDLLDGAVARDGQAGVTKVADLTMEAMRLSRNHPALTANDWFGHMLFADEIGNKGVRAAGEMRELIVSALAGRNFSLNGTQTAEFSLKNGTDEVTGYSAGSRRMPIPVTLPADGKATYHLAVSLKDSEAYHFQYPVKVRVFLRTGPLQGAIHWDGEENTSLDYTLGSASDVLPIDLTANGKCDEVNRDDGSCVDFAYVQIFNSGSDAKPVAKKRFYLRVSTQQ